MPAQCLDMRELWTHTLTHTYSLRSFGWSLLKKVPLIKHVARNILSGVWSIHSLGCAQYTPEYPANRTRWGGINKFMGVPHSLWMRPRPKWTAVMYMSSGKLLPPYLKRLFLGAPFLSLLAGKLCRRAILLGATRRASTPRRAG